MYDPGLRGDIERQYDAFLQGVAVPDTPPAPQPTSPGRRRSTLPREQIEKLAAALAGAGWAEAHPRSLSDSQDVLRLGRAGWEGFNDVYKPPVGISPERAQEWGLSDFVRDFYNSFLQPAERVIRLPLGLAFAGANMVGQGAQELGAAKSSADALARDLKGMAAVGAMEFMGPSWSPWLHRPAGAAGPAARSSSGYRTAGQIDLANALRSGEFDAIDFGEISQAKFDAINKILAANGAQTLVDRELVIPANVVRKLAEKRVRLEHMTPDAVADLVFSVFHNSATRVGPSNHPHIVELLLPRERRARVGYIAADPTSGETVVKSAYQKDLDRFRE